MKRSLEYDLNFINNNPSLTIGIPYISSEEYFNKIKQNINNVLRYTKKFYIYTPHETIKCKNLLNLIIELLDSINSLEDVEVYLLMTTSSHHKYFLNPLCSILHYQNYFTKAIEEVNESVSENDLFKLNFNKINKGILSIRTSNQQRDTFYNKFSGKFDGFYQFLEYDNKQNSMNFFQLIQKIKSSYVYFNFETLSDTNINCFSEKSLIGFLSGVLPILYLENKNHLIEFEKMGFYLLNREFNYTEATDNTNYNVDMFIECINLYNELSLSDINGIYNRNLDKIKMNHKIASDILFKNLNKNNQTFFLKQII